MPDALALQGVLRHRVDEYGLSPGMAVGITDDGQRRFHAHGVAGTGLPPVDEDTVFELGSITKLFTALLLADMAGHNQVALDEPVAALLPTGTPMPRHGEAITLRHLAMHTAGLPRVPAGLPLDSPDPYANYSAERLYAALVGVRLARRPGDAFEYSNLGAGLLGHALGLRAGQGYEALLAARILAPLGMASTAFHLPPALAAHTGRPLRRCAPPIAQRVRRVAQVRSSGSRYRTMSRRPRPAASSSRGGQRRGTGDHMGCAASPWTPPGRHLQRRPQRHAGQGACQSSRTQGSASSAFNRASSIWTSSLGKSTGLGW